MKEIEVLAKTDNLRVRIMALEPREVAGWHYHTQVADNIFCLTGTILIRLQNPDEEVRLSPGQRCQIKIGRVHQLENLESEDATYLLVQGIGVYDFNVVGKKQLTLR
ncbi:MAG: cupin domain-containing protein [Chloroflexi bacterium]|nr:cupin domain-containing protein [Chloroflexota bacterium]